MVLCTHLAESPYYDRCDMAISMLAHRIHCYPLSDSSTSCERLVTK